MREILFRGKLKSTGEWVEGGIVHDNDRTFIVIKIRYIPDTRDWDTAEYYENNPHYTYSNIEVDPETVGQYTGLKDKNGKKMFEGDIVDTPRWIVSYCADTNEGLGMNAGWYLQRDNFESWMELENIRDHIVLGNIHDNPELLEVK